jgi:Sep-tRNA:Cys-tRNA synthetase
MESSKLQKYCGISRNIEESFINIHPIQRGGVLTAEARKVLLDFGDGYSMCDYCFEARIVKVKKPPVVDFMQDLATFLDIDEVRPTAGARHAKRAVMEAITEPGDTVVLDSLAHYTTYITAEAAKLNVKEIPHSGYPDFSLNVEEYATKIEEVEDSTGKLPALVVLTHVDYNYGNLSKVKRVAEITKKYGVPFLLNGAYTVGIMPVSGRDLGVDFLLASGHKSMSASAPIGLLGATSEWAEKVFERSSIKGDWSGRTFGAKEIHILGCPPVFGPPLATLMASFPKVVERVKHWDEEVEKARYFSEGIQKIDGIKQLGNKPKEHTLTHFESPSFHEVAQHHKRKGFFLYDALKKKKIMGIHPGLSKSFKVNTFGLTSPQVEYIVEVFQEIAEQNGITTH